MSVGGSSRVCSEPSGGLRERSSGEKKEAGFPEQLAAAAGSSSTVAEAAATKLRFLRETCHQSNWELFS